MLKLRGYFFVAVAAAFWGTSATFVKFLFNKTYDPLIIVQMRTTIAFVVLILYFLIFNRSLLRIKLKDIPLFLFVGIFGVAGSNYFYYAAIKETSVALSILVQYTAPILVMLYVTIVQKEKLGVAKFAALVISFLGIFFAVGGYNKEIFQANSSGIVLALLAAISYSIFTVGGKPLTKKYSVWTAIIYVFGSTALFWLFVNPPNVIIEAHYSLNDWGIFAFVSTITVLIPYGLYFFGLHYLQPSRAIITSTLEPIVAIISEWIFLSGVLGVMQIIGTVCVVFAIILLQLTSHNEEITIAQE
ncbi:MAG: EamA family transporter [Bacteroidetes bacterium]|nr:EamA family transporter [Bacteroidota bacterium]